MPPEVSAKPEDRLPGPDKSYSLFRLPFGPVSALFRRPKQQPAAAALPSGRPKTQAPKAATKQLYSEDLLQALLVPPSLDSRVRIWHPDDPLPNYTLDDCTLDQLYFDPLWTSLPSAVTPTPAVDALSLSASTASSIPALSHDSKSECDVPVVPVPPPPKIADAAKCPNKRTSPRKTHNARASPGRTPGRAVKNVRPRASSANVRGGRIHKDPLGNEVSDQLDGLVTANIKLSERYPPESLPPALREITPEEAKMSLVCEGTGPPDGPLTPSGSDRGEPVLDRFGFQMVEIASRHSLRKFQYQKAQKQKLDWWAKFRQQCQAELCPDGVIVEDMPLRMAGWGTAGDTGRALQAKFTELVRQGIPVELRAEVWKEAVSSRVAMSPGDYDSYLHRADAELSAEVERDIEFDVGRTLTHSNVFFYAGTAVGSARLRALLRAYAARNPDTGYCQGMNKIGAYVLLTVPDEPTAFHVLCAMLDGLMPARYWTDSMNLASADQHVLKSVLSREVPDVYIHLHALNSFVVPFTLRWFVSLFTDGVGAGTSAEFVYRVWDVVVTRPFPDGYNYLLAVAVAIFWENRAAILAAKTTMEVHDVIAHRLGVRDDRVRAVLEKADEVAAAVPVRVLDGLRDRARAQLECGDANAEGDIPGCVSAKVLGKKGSVRFLDLGRLR